MNLFALTTHRDAGLFNVDVGGEVTQKRKVVSTRTVAELKADGTWRLVSRTIGSEYVSPATVVQDRSDATPYTGPEA